jgi:predicted nucleic acid-binding protein
VILVDTSVWVEHFRQSNEVLDHWLDQERVVVHPFVLGELVLGNYSALVLDQLAKLRTLNVARADEVYQFILAKKLFGRGIGYVDTHLIAAVRLSPGVAFWTLDKRLDRVAAELGIRANPTN